MTETAREGEVVERLELVIRLRARADWHRPTISDGGYGFYAASDGLLDVEAADTITALRAEVERLREERDGWKSECQDRHKRMCEARDALFQFQYPPCPEMLRKIADEIDCGSSCEYCHTEWDTNAHSCSRSDKGECTGEMAWSLREFADALATRTALSKEGTHAAE